MVEINRTKPEIVRLSKKGNSSKKNTNPNDKKSNYFLNPQFELFYFSKSRTISALPSLLLKLD